jgi:hypothetical protein
MEYRADPSADVWHFCPTCSKWPETPLNVLWLDEPPNVLKLCPECLALMPGVSAHRAKK